MFDYNQRYCDSAHKVRGNRLVFDGLRIFAAATVAFEQPNLGFAGAFERFRIAPHQMRVAGHAGRTGNWSDMRNVSEDRVGRGHGENLDQKLSTSP